jgi:hypothetical protein
MTSRLLSFRLIIRPVVAVTACVSLLALLAVVGQSGRLSQARAADATAQSAWTPVFRDDFSGTANSPLDSNWLYDLGTSYPGGAAQWGTGEIETATNSTANVYQDGSGHLVIKPIRSASGQWTSGRVETQRTDFVAPVGGQLEITASIRQPNPASGIGYWPAFWALGAAARGNGATGWPAIGELDVMEDVNAGSQVSHTFHCGVWGEPPCNEPDGISSGLINCHGCQTAFHTYSVILDRTNAADEQLRFYTDGVRQYVVNQDQVGPDIWAAAVHHGFFVILNVAIDGSYPNKVCSCDSTAVVPTSGAGMSVDYVAVSQKTPTTVPPTTVPPTTAAPTTAPTTTAAPTTPPTTTAAPTTPSTTTTAPTTAAPTTPPTTTAMPPAPGFVIQAEAFTTQSGTRSQPTSDTGGGTGIGWIGNGDWLAYRNVDFGSKPQSQFVARVASGAAAGVSGTIQVHLDSLSSPSVSSFDVANTGSWQSWRTVPANMAATTGVHTVYVQFVSGSASDFVNLNWFQFAA